MSTLVRIIGTVTGMLVIAGLISSFWVYGFYFGDPAYLVPSTEHPWPIELKGQTHYLATKVWWLAAFSSRASFMVVPFLLTFIWLQRKTTGSLRKPDR